MRRSFFLPEEKKLDNIIKLIYKTLKSWFYFIVVLQFIQIILKKKGLLNACVILRLRFSLIL